MVEYKVIRYNVVPSTMDIAKALAAQGYPEWTIVLAKEQTGGRGRYGRKWLSPRGGLWFSIILKPKFESIYLTLIGITASVAIAQVLSDKYRLNVSLKWPNDVLINDKKVAGVLTEVTLSGNIIEYVVLGVGVNTNIDLTEIPDEFKSKVVSLKEILGREISNEELLDSIVKRFYDLYQMIPHKRDIIVNLWRKLSSTVGSYVRVRVKGGEITGKALDIDELGRLLVEREDGSIIRIDEGEVIHLREVNQE